MRVEYVQAVLEVAALIPAGQVLSYGDIAVLLEHGGPRQVGSVMSHHGSDAPWWRVIRASGEPVSHHESAALSHYVQEETALRGEIAGEHPSWRVNMATARWNPSEEAFVQIDAIAAVLHAAVPVPGMSEPHDGLQA